MKRRRLWKVQRSFLFVLCVILLCLTLAVGDSSDDVATLEEEDEVEDTKQEVGSGATNPSEESQSAAITSTLGRTFTPILNEHGEPGSIQYYVRDDGQFALRYWDHVGLVDAVVPTHFRLLSNDRVVYELRWHYQNGGNWTERTCLEILYYALTQPPPRDDSIFDDVDIPPKAAVKQHQRHLYFLTASRRTYQQFQRENAIAAATAHRAGTTGQHISPPSASLASTSSGSSPSLFHNTHHGVPVLARKMDNAFGWMRDDTDICEWEGVVCGDFSATSQYYWNTAGIMTTLDHDNKYIQQEKWTCDHCPKEAAQHVTKLELPYAGLVGTLPTQVAQLRYLHRLDLRGNRISGSLPTTLHQMQYLQYLDLTRNDLSGTIAGVATTTTNTAAAAATTVPPSNPAQQVALGEQEEDEAQVASTQQQQQQQRQDTTPPPPPPPSPQQAFPEHIREIWLGSNKLKGSIPLEWKTPLLMHLDLSKNELTGSLPRYGRKQLPKLKSLLLEDNQLTGKIPPKWAGLTHLEVIDVGGNRLNGTIPTIFGTLTNLRELNIVGNRVSGTIPTELLQLTQLESLMLSENRLKGTIPAGDDTVPHRAMREPEAGYKWSQLSDLQFFHASDNFLTSTIPPDLFYGLSKTIQSLDFSYNEITGTIPREIAKCANLERINGQSNFIRGTLPSEMSRMNPNLELNFTNNLLTGSIPTMFCGGGPTSMNFLYRQFACDAVLCPPRTFHPTGAATLHSGCMPCPRDAQGEKLDPPISKRLGRTRCASPKVRVTNADVNGDGKVSPREVLRLLFVETIGRFWGNQFQNWIDMDVNECDLYGVTCVNGHVAKLDLVNAAMCSNGEHKSGLVPDCRGLPTELALLTRMEVLTLTRRQFLVGTIPSEIGLMTRLKYIDISECPYMSGPLPSELGKLTNLKYFNVIGSSFNQSVPPELFRLPYLEKLHLSNNIFTGTLPSSAFGNLQSVKELFYSNNFLVGPIPREVGNLTKLENIEMYGNELNGTIPETLARCTNLKRIDLFSNKLTGTIPKAIAQVESLQILHLKMNQLTGTIPIRYGELPFLSWFDVSHNYLHGTIPATFAHSRSIKDFRLGGNMFYEPIPPALCANTNVNGGLTATYGCDGVICPLGTYSDSGHATHADNGCRKCPDGETTLYLGSTGCRPFSQEDILSILFDAMQGERWPDELRENWKNEHVDVCYWSGIICDTKGEIVSIGFPTAWDDWANEGLAAPDP